MGQITAKLTVLFEDPFYVALYERTENGATQVCRVVFGKEPSDAEVYAYFLENWPRLKFSPPVPADLHALEEHKNPKRVQREIQKHLAPAGIGTKSQQALKLQQEQAKTQRKQNRRLRLSDEAERRYRQRKEKKKQKHRGR